MKNPKNTTIGIVVIISIAILVWGINFLKGLDIFTKERTYYAKYERVDGLKKSSSVTLKGYKIGQINKISFSNKDVNHIIVAFSIQENFRFPKNTVTRIRSSDIMGTKEIKIIPGTSKQYLNPGDTLYGTIEGDLKEQVSMQMLPLKAKAEKLIASVDSVLAVIQYVFDENTRDNLSKSFASIRLTIKNLENASGTLDTLMIDQQGKLGSIFANIDLITYNLKNNNENISNILQNFSSISDSLSKAKIAKTINEVNLALTQTNSLMTKINSGEGSLGALINNDTLYRNLESASGNLSILLADLKQNPKKYVRFSLLDMGRTVYQPDKALKQNDKEKTVFYRVQILSSPNPVSLNDKSFKNYKDIQELKIDNGYKYTMGYTQNYREIIRLLKKVKKDFPNASVIKLMSDK